MTAISIQSIDIKLISRSKPLPHRFISYSSTEFLKKLLSISANSWSTYKTLGCCFKDMLEAWVHLSVRKIFIVSQNSLLSVM